MKRFRATLCEQEAEGMKLDAANLRVRRSASEGRKELGYGG